MEHTPYEPSSTGNFKLMLWCLVAAPGLGLVAAGFAPNPPGDGPGAMQVVLGTGVPAVISFLVARRGARTSRFAAGAWAVASVAATGMLLLLLIMFVFSVIDPR
jgi:hypothetical protein